MAPRLRCHAWLAAITATTVALWACLAHGEKPKLAPNQLLGSCLSDAWADDVAAKLQIDRHERDTAGRLVHPFLRAALHHPLQTIEDERTALPDVYGPSCLGEGTTLYGAGAKRDTASGELVDAGRVNGSLVLEYNGWPSHSLTTLVYALLANEVLGYPVSIYDLPDTLGTTERMSSVRSGLCTPTHVNVEVWLAGVEAALQVYANESFQAGSTGYFGRVGLYTTTDFVESSMAAAPALIAEHWKSYKYYEQMIKAVPVSYLRKYMTDFPSSEIGCADGSFGCLNNCSRSLACTERERKGGECMGVAMMYDIYDPGYLQAVMANIGLAAYFCFLGRDSEKFVLHAQREGKAALFYHFEPDLFHITNAGLFQRVFLPRPVPERVVLATGTFGENGYGAVTSNPVDVDFPMAKLAKYAATRIYGTRAEHLLSKLTLQELDINDLMGKYINASKDEVPDPTFSAACAWVRENYLVWSLWLDRLPVCAFDTHIQYTVTGCNDPRRVVSFAWTQPDPDDPSLPDNCDGGLAKLPAALATSRSCEWIQSDTTKWRDWVRTKPECDASFYKYNVTECDSRAKRTVKFWWLLPDPANPRKSLECANGVALPADTLVDCEYMPTSSPAFFAMLTIAGTIIAVLCGAAAFVFIEREKPIVKRSQYEMLILMIVGGILVCVAAILYAGKPSHALCAARPLTISLGFTTIFGSLFVKSLRVYRVFFRSAMKRVAITMRMMLKVFAVFFVVDVLILSGWFVVDFPAPTTTTVAAPEFRGDVDRVTCKSGSFLFTAVLMFWKAIVLFLGLYLSFLIRNVSSDFQESIWIFASSLIVLIACLVVLPLAYVVEMAAAVFYVFLASALLLSTAIVMGMMLGPKVLRLNEDSKTSSTTNEASVNGASGALGSKVSRGSISTLAMRNSTSARVASLQRPRVGSNGAAYVQPTGANTADEESEATHT